MPRKTFLHALRISHDDSDVGLSTCTLSTSSSVLEDIDENDAERHECIVEYAEDVMNDLRRKEEQQHSTLRLLPPSAVDRRSALLGWSQNVRQRFALLLDTTLMAVAILDRFMSLSVTGDGTGANDINVMHAGAALLLSAALEETYAPTAEDMLQACISVSFRPPSHTLPESSGVFDNAHMLTRAQLCSATSEMAHALGYDLWSINFLHFLRRFSRASQHTISEHNRAKKFCIEALQHYDAVVLPLRPSAIAAAGIYHTRSSFPQRFQRPWSKTLAHFSGYSEEQAAQYYCIVRQCKTLREPENGL